MSPITSAELVKYQPVNVPEDDTSTAGGAISTAGQYDELVLATTSALEILSDNAGDTTQTVTVTGRNAAGSIVSDSATLSGTTVVALTGAVAFERIMKVVKSATTTGTVTVRTIADVNVCTLAPAITSQKQMFYDAQSGASIKKHYEMERWKNEDPALDLTSATCELTADPQARIRIAEETSANQTVTNRLTEPSGSPVWNDDASSFAISGGTLEFGTDAGIWVEMNLPANDPAFKSTYTTKVAGATT